MYAEAVARKIYAVLTGDSLQGVNEMPEPPPIISQLIGNCIARYDRFLDALIVERGHEFLYGGFRKIDQIRSKKNKQITQLSK